MTIHSHYQTSTATRQVWLGWLAFAAIWFATLGHNALIHPDEGRYATISLEMLHSGDWITPRLNGLLYFEKPVLPYWLGAISFWLLGVNEFAARLWPALAGFLSIVAVGATARRLWGEEAGHLAALVMGSSCWTMANAHFLNLDTGLTLFLTLALCTFLLAQREDSGHAARRGWMWGCWAAMAGATLSKGLIGIMIPGAVLILYSLVWRKFAFWRQLHLFTGLLLFLLLTAPWFIAVSHANPGFARFFFIHEHFERFLTTEHHRNGPWWYFVPYLLAGFLPWTTLLPALIIQGCRRDGRAPVQHDRILLIWALFVFLFFSVSGSKLPSYILPMFPALALLAAHHLSQRRPAPLSLHLIAPALVWLALLAAYPYASQWAGNDVPLAALRHVAGFVAYGSLLFLLGAACSWRFLVLERKLEALMVLTLASLAALSFATVGYGSYAELKSARAAAAATRSLSAGASLFSVRYYDQTWPFYLQRPVTLVDYVDEFELGEKTEPGRWIPTLDGFVARWRQAPHALAMMGPDTYNELNQRGVPMRVIYRDVRRMVVAKP